MHKATSPQLPNRVKDITGQRFGRLTALKLVGRLNRETIWQFICDCGTVIETQGYSVTKGVTRSCGCYRREVSRPILAKRTKHGCAITGKHHPMYNSWYGMKARCNNPNSTVYKNYGGRGIVVCERWMDFKNFYSDMLPTWKPGLTIDRIDNDGPYCKANCQWATRRQQRINQRPRKKYQQGINP